MQINFQDSIKAISFWSRLVREFTRVKKSIDANEVGKYFSNLNRNEINFLEMSHKKFFQNFSYLKNIKKFSIISSVKIILKIYIQNLLEAKEVIPKKNFLAKYLYYILILNNFFFNKKFIPN